MKRSTISFLIVFVVAAFSTSALFAESNPIPGIDVVVKKNPGGIAVTILKTDKAGMFSIKLGALLTKDGSRYDFKLSYDAIMKMLSRTDPAFAKNKENYLITLQLTSSSPGLTVNDKPVPVKITIDSTTETVSIFDRWGSQVVSGTLTYGLRGVKPAGQKE